MAQSTPVAAPATKIEYAILVSDGEAWMQVDHREISRMIASGFVPVIKIFAAR